MWPPALTSDGITEGDHKGRPYTERAMPTFIGLDLAWTTRNESGICWLEGDSRENLRCTRLETKPCETAALADEVVAARPEVATIDAPILYSPERWAESEVARRFGRYKIGAHSAHAAWRNGYRAGFDLADALAQRGFTCDPNPMLRRERQHPVAVEVFPHTIHVILFGLDERLPYKRKKGRDTPFLQRVLQEYQRHLKALIERECPLVLEHDAVQEALDPANARSARGQSLKRLDDTLDGLTCAISAWLMWDRPEQWEVLGDLNGYIVVPRERGATVRESKGPLLSVELDADDAGAVVEARRNGLRRKIRVRLQGDNLSRVVTVVERLEQGPGH